MTQRERDALRKLFLKTTVEDFDALIENVLNNPGQYAKPNDEMLKSFIVEMAVVKLRMMKVGRNQRLSEQRRWIAFALRFLEPICNRKSFANDARDVLMIMIEGKDDGLLHYRFQRVPKCA